MKNILYRRLVVGLETLLKSKKTTMLALLLLLGAVCAIPSYSQSKKVTISSNKMSMSQVIQEIEKQTDYLFVFNAEEVNLNKTVQVNAKNRPVADVLKSIFKGTKISYEMNGKNIMLVEGKTRQSAQSAGQERRNRVTGLVKDENGEPIIGANVSVKGESMGAISDINGNFALNAPDNATLSVSFIGYTPIEVKLAGRKNISVVLKESSKLLNEVVVVGYGIQKKANLSGSVTQLDSKKLENRPIANVSNGIQGLMPGITVTGTNGAPGMDGGSIRVRGVGTLNTASPYILVDGFETSTLNSIDPDDIESISVLKDASSAAIYGSKASNGVILITTKRGHSGAPKISYTGYVGFQNASQMVDRMSSADYATYYNQALVANGKKAKYTEDEIKKFADGSDPYNYPNTDWTGLAFKTGVMTRHNVNVTGGSDQMKYMASVGYLHQTGVLPNAQREQFNARTNFDVNLTKRLTAHLNLAFIRNNYKDPSSAYAGGSSDQIIRQLNLIAPWIVNKYQDGTYGTISDGNPMAWLDSEMTVNRNNSNFTGMLGLDYQIMDGLKLTLQGSYVDNYQHYKYFQKFIQYNANKKSDPSSLDDRHYKWDRTNYDALLNYDKQFGQHGLKVMAGWHTEKYNYSYNKSYRKNFPNNDLTDINAGDASTQTNEGNTRELAMISYFGRLNYDFVGKYLFEANFRADASSRFAQGNRWGYFPSFSAAWRLSEEKFMEGIKGTLDNLKIRASWGQLGNQDALDDYYPWMNTYNLGASYPFDGALNTGYYQSNYHLSTISWEKATTWGIGIDFGLFSKLTGSIDYYNRKTTGIIMNVDAPAEFALGSYKDNIGSMRNQGIEVSLAYSTKLSKDWGIDVSANFAYNANKILDLGGGPDKYISNGNKRHKVGEQFNSFYLYRANGFFQSDEEAAAYTAKYGNPFGKKFKAGDLIYDDADGSGKLDSNDKVYYKNTDMPAITYNFNIGVTYKNFDLSTIWQGVDKVAHIYDTEAYGEFVGDSSHPATIWKDAWTSTNTNAKMPRIAEARTSPSNQRNVMSTFWLSNTGYLRLKTLQVGYTFPKSILNVLGVSNLRLYYSAENLLTIDHMKINIDPEATSDRISSYPLLRTHSFGVNLTF
jgi:TonB-linked SusC/RagA family outer membrane protein